MVAEQAARIVWMACGPELAVWFSSGDLAAAVPLMLAIGIQSAQEKLAGPVAGINPSARQPYAVVVNDDRSGTMEMSLALLGTYAVRSMSVLPRMR